LHLNIVHDSAQRNQTQRHTVAEVWLNSRTTLNYGTSLQAFRSNDVPLLPISILNESNAAASVWIIFNVSHSARHTVLIALEVDNSVHALVTTTTMLRGELTLIVSAALLLVADDQFLLRSLATVGNFSEIADRRSTATRSHWLVKSNTHIQHSL